MAYRGADRLLLALVDGFFGRSEAESAIVGL